MGNNSLSALIAAALLGRMQRAAPRRSRYAPEEVSSRFDRACGYDVTRVRYTPTSRYRPHQSTRECMRRIGGGMWAQFKSDDRVRRGLPATKTTGA